MLLRMFTAPLGCKAVRNDGDLQSQAKLRDVGVLEPPDLRALSQLGMEFNSEKKCCIAYGRVQGKRALTQHFPELIPHERTSAAARA
jgi:hypothetical protein